jgi:diguanylate cyclase (GGDEF)-like protein
MSGPHPPPPGPSRGGGRPPLSALVAALQTALAGLEQSHVYGLEDGEGSVRRLVRALLDLGVTQQRPDVLVAANSVLSAPSGAAAAPGAEFLRLLTTEPAAAGGGSDQVILVVEDDRLFGATLKTSLTALGRRIEVVGTAAEARQRLAGGHLSLVVLDLILPDGDGRNLLLDIRSDPRTAALPLFVVSARLGSHTKAECFALGADAYFQKPIDLPAFAVAVTSRLERHRDHSTQARRDTVTGLANRAAFIESVAHLREKSAPGTAFSLAVMDLDHFAWVNETWGRQFADSVLRRAGVRLAMMLRQASVFARWDGAEFIAFFAGRSATAAGAAVEAALATLRRVDFRQGPEDPLALTFSAGVVDVVGDQPLDDAIAAADRLGYLAKAGGRNRVVTSDAEPSVPTRRILVAEDDPDLVRLLTRHLRREGFEVQVSPDGAQALAAFPDSGAALVISDIEMPNLDGLGLLRGIREHPAGRHLPVMMLTAMGDENYIVRAFELGADDYVLKPFSARELAARVRRLLRRPSVTGIPAQA